MSIYVYDGKNTDNFDTIGLVGALEAISCVFTEESGESAITMVHPYDKHGKWRALVNGNIIKAEVPVLTVPEISDGQIVTTVETWTVKATATKPQRYIYSRQSGGSKRKLLSVGTKVTVTNKYPEETSSRYKVKTGKVTGYMESAALEYETTHVLDSNVNNLESVIPAWETREQYFRICDRKPADTSLIVYARHISYDLLGVLTNAAGTGSYDLKTVVEAILERTSKSHEFTAQTNIGDKRTGINYAHVNPIEAFLDPETGVVKLWNCQMVRDNNEFTFLRGIGKDRGFRVEYGKNMTGVNCDVSDEEVITRVLPTGLNKDGKTLYLTDSDWTDAANWVTAENADSFSVPHDVHLECGDCTVGENDVTVSVARARMLEQAQELLANGANMSVVSMDVTFANLGDTVEYKGYKTLLNAYLYDKVYVNIPHIGMTATLDVVKIEWDCILQRFQKLYLGALDAIEVSIQNYQLAGGITGNKLVAGTIGAGNLGSGVIAAWHLQSDSVSTKALQAGSVTAEKIAAGSITAEQIAAGSITADKIAAGALSADKIAAGSVTADKIAAGAITADKLEAGAVTAEKIEADAVTAEHIKAGTITADSGIIADGAIGTAQIADGSITSAKVVELNADVIKAGTLSAERLLLVGEDGVIHKINASALGVSTSVLTQDEYKNQLDGTVIIAKSITAAQIAAQTITGNEILAGSITAKEIDVSDLFAAEATIQQLNAMDISGNAYLKLMVSSAVDSIKVGGRNYLKESDVAVSTISSILNYYYFGDEIPEYGKTYTVRIWGAVGSGGTGFAVYAGSTLFGAATALDDGTYVYTGTWPVSGATYIRVIKAPSNNTSEFSISRIKLEEGSAPTDWTPHPEEFKAGSSIFMTEDEVSISTPKFGVDIVGSDGETNMLTIDETGAQMTNLSAPNVAPRYDGPGMLYVRPGATDEQLSNGNHFRSLADALAALSYKWIQRNVTIDLIADMVEYGKAVLKGCAGGEWINIIGKTGGHAKIVGSIEISHCASPVSITCVDVDSALNAVAIDVKGGYADISNCIITGRSVLSAVGTADNSLSAGIKAQQGARVVVAGCEIYDVHRSLYTMTLGTLMANANKGNALVGVNRTHMFVSGTAPCNAASWTYSSIAGGQVWGSPSVNQGSKPTAEPEPTEKVIPASATGAYSGSWRSDGVIRQGIYQGKQYAGCMWFPTAAFSGKTIKGATLTFTRIGGSGRSGNIVPHLYTTTLSGASGNPLSNRVYYGKLDSIGNGETKTVTLPVAAVQALADGTAKGLMFYEDADGAMSGKVYSSNYCKIVSSGDDLPVLTVNY